MRFKSLLLVMLWTLCLARVEMAEDVRAYVLALGGAGMEGEVLHHQEESFLAVVKVVSRAV